MASLTRIPAVLDKLLEVSAVRDDVPVLDGPTLGEIPPRVIIVGMPSMASDGSGYTTTYDRMEGYGRTRYVERWTVSCCLSLLSAHAGRATVKGLRDEAGDILSEIDTALRDLGAVEGVWDRANLTGDATWLPVQHPQGTSMHVFYDIAGEVPL